MDRDFIVPWALTIADALENGRDWDRKEIAAHLRRLHAEVEALRTALAEPDPAVQRDLAFQNMARIIRELKEEQQGGQA